MYAGKVFFQMSCLGSPDPRPILRAKWQFQCCESGFGIREPMPFWTLDQGSGMGKKSWSGYGIRIRYEQPGSYFRKLKKLFFGLKYLNPLIRIRDPGLEKVGSGIRDKHSWSATLVKVLKFLIYWPKFSGFLLLFDPGSGIQDSGWISNIKNWTDLSMKKSDSTHQCCGGETIFFWLRLCGIENCGLQVTLKITFLND